MTKFKDNEKLKKRNKVLESVYNNIKQGVCIHKIIYDNNKPVDYKILEANTAYEKILGISLQKVIGSLASEIYEIAPPPCLNTYAKVAKTGETTSFDTYYSPMNKYFEITVTSPEKGKFITLFNDITDRKKRKEKLKKNQRRLQKNKENLKATLNSIGDAVIATDTDGHITRMNPVTEKLTDWSFTNAEGKPLTEVFKIVNAKTKKTVENPVQEVLQTGKKVGLANHTMLISKGGKEYQIADCASPIRDNESNIIGIVLVFRNVTEKYRMREKLKESEKRMNKTLSAIPDMVSMQDTDMNIIYCNWKGIANIPQEKRKLYTK
jgi:PAS domain S-box-containing protein